MRTCDYIFEARRRLLESFRSLRPDLLSSTPLDARPFVLTSVPFPNYPAVGPANRITVLSYQVPPGMLAVLSQWAIVHVGGGFVDGSGTIIWRLLVNRAAVEGLNDIEAHIGSLDNLNDLKLVAMQNDLVEVTVETAGAGAPPGTSTGARFSGFTYPLEKTRARA